MRPLLPLALPLLLAACADAGAPSLAPRPIETLDLTEPAEAGPVPAPPADPALAARYAGIVAAAQAGDGAFTREEQGARAAANGARGARVGSDAWVGAQQAVTRLEAARDPVGKALADLDAEHSAAAVDPIALEAAIKEVGAIDRRERERLAAITALLATP